MNVNETELFVLHKDGKLLVTSVGKGFRSRNRHWVFRTIVQAELHAKRHDAEVVKYTPEKDIS